MKKKNLCLRDTSIFRPYSLLQLCKRRQTMSKVHFFVFKTWGGRVGDRGRDGTLASPSQELGVNKDIMLCFICAHIVLSTTRWSNNTVNHWGVITRRRQMRELARKSTTGSRILRVEFSFILVHSSLVNLSPTSTVLNSHEYLSRWHDLTNGFELRPRRRSCFIWREFKRSDVS